MRLNWKLVTMVVAAVGILGVAGWWIACRFERNPPVIVAPPLAFIGKATPWTLVVSDGGSGLREIAVEVKQKGAARKVLDEPFSAGHWWGGGGPARREVKTSFDARALALEDGAATIEVSARDWSLWGFSGNRTRQEFQVTVDTSPPRIELLSNQNYIAPGGTGVVTYRLSEEPAGSGVKVGERFFKGYPEKGTPRNGHVAFFVLPAEGLADKPLLTAVDRAGNEARMAIPFTLLPRAFRADSVEISDAFLQRKIPEFAAADPKIGDDPVKGYLTVNRDWRVRDHKRFAEITSTSNPERLWKGAFLQMKNTKKMASFADRRTYIYHGKAFDEQTHLGLDLASTTAAPVPAANDGMVLFIGDLGIYGQTVILDHGQGLCTSYSHLSAISVTKGQRVAKGETLGNTGQTGMAAGDHLHFAVLIDGVFTTPVEWFDEHWIKDNVEGKLELLKAGI